MNTNFGVGHFLKEGDVMIRKNLSKYVMTLCADSRSTDSNSTLERIANEGSRAFYYGEIGMS